MVGKEFTEIEKISICDYITKLVTIVDIPDVQTDAPALDVTDVVKLVFQTTTDTKRYFLVPVHNRYYMDRLYHNIHNRNKGYKKEKETLAKTFFDILLRYSNNKYVFNYFLLVAMNGNEIYKEYKNEDLLVTDVVEKIFEIGITNSSAPYLENTVPKEYEVSGKRFEAMQYMDYNGNEILDWVKSANTIVVNPYIRNDVGIKQLAIHLDFNKVFHMILNDYIVKVSEDTFVILSENIFKSLFEIYVDDVNIYYYSSDMMLNEPVEHGDIVNDFVQSDRKDISLNSIVDINVTAGSTRVLFAYPESDPNVMSISRLDYQGDLDYIDIFEQTIVPIMFSADNVVNYRVYYWITTEAFAADMKLRFKFQ